MEIRDVSNLSGKEINKLIDQLYEAGNRNAAAPYILTPDGQIKRELVSNLAEYQVVPGGMHLIQTPQGMRYYFLYEEKEEYYNEVSMQGLFRKQSNRYFLMDVVFCTKTSPKDLMRYINAKGYKFIFGEEYYIPSRTVSKSECSEISDGYSVIDDIIQKFDTSAWHRDTFGKGKEHRRFLTLRDFK